MASLQTIQAQIARLQAQANELAAKKPIAVLDKIRDLMEKHGISVADIEAHAGRRRERRPQASAAVMKDASVARYLDPKTGTTWTGHGRAPAWIASVKCQRRLKSAPPFDDSPK